MKRARAIALLMLALTACSGPNKPLVVGVKEINTDVLIGPQGPLPGPPPPPSSGPPIGFPGFVQPPTLPGPNAEPSPPPFCPAAKPFASVKRPTTTVATKGPVPATYAFRDDGIYKVGDRSGSFPKVSSRTIENVDDDAEGGGFTFDVTIPGAPGQRTTTTYHVYPTQTDTLSPAAGIYIEQVVTRNGAATADTFQPVPSLLLMPFPAAVASDWDARGVDPVNQIVMQYSGEITSRGIVDACGTRLEGWVVDITDGVIRSPTVDVTFSATLTIAPQYGGISLLDKVLRTGTEDGEPVEIENRSRITREPEVRE